MRAGRVHRASWAAAFALAAVHAPCRADIIELRGSAAPIDGDTVRSGPAGIEVRTRRAGLEQVQNVPWSEVRAVRGAGVPKDAAQWLAAGEALWRGRTRVARGDWQLALEPLERAARAWAGAAPSADGLAAESACAEALRRAGRAAEAVRPAFEAIRVARAGIPADAAEARIADAESRIFDARMPIPASLSPGAFDADGAKAVRAAMAGFDAGGDAGLAVVVAAYLDALLCTKLPRLGRITLAYALLPDGKILSEFTVARLADDHFYLVGAAGAEWHDMDVLEATLPADGSVTLHNISKDHGSLVVVGPHAREVLAQVTTTSLENADFPWLSIRDIDTAVGSVRTLRVGYVGELGWELHAANDQLVALYDAIWAAGEQYGIADFGIYAVDSLRLDKGYRGWKGDLEIGFSPFDASLDRFVDMTKPSFVGKDALVEELQYGSTWRFVSMTLDEAGVADAPALASIFDGDERVGLVTSGGWSFTLNQSIAIGYVHPKYEAPGTKVEVLVYGERVTATVGAEPLYDPTNARLRS